MFMCKLFENFVKLCFSIPDPVFSSIARTITNERNIVSAYSDNDAITNKFIIFCKMFYDQSGEIHGLDYAKFKKVFGASKLFCRFLLDNKIVSTDFYEKANILYVMFENKEYETLFNKIRFENFAQKEQPDDNNIAEMMEKIRKGELDVEFDHMLD